MLVPVEVFFIYCHDGPKVKGPANEGIRRRGLINSRHPPVPMIKKRADGWKVKKKMIKNEKSESSW
jgi:hypothetical protein